MKNIFKILILCVFFIGCTAVKPENQSLNEASPQTSTLTPGIEETTTTTTSSSTTTVVRKVIAFNNKTNALPQTPPQINNSKTVTNSSVEPETVTKNPTTTSNNANKSPEQPTASTIDRAPSTAYNNAEIDRLTNNDPILKKEAAPLSNTNNAPSANNSNLKSQYPNVVNSKATPLLTNNAPATLTAGPASNTALKNTNSSNFNNGKESLNNTTNPVAIQNPATAQKTASSSPINNSTIPVAIQNPATVKKTASSSPTNNRTNLVAIQNPTTVKKTASSSSLNSSNPSALVTKNDEYLPKEAQILKPEAFNAKTALPVNNSNNQAAITNTANNTSPSAVSKKAIASTVEAITIKNPSNFENKQQLSSNTASKLKYASLPFDLFVNPLYKKETYESDAKHTLVIELEKSGSGASTFNFDVILPQKWNLIALTPSAELIDDTKKLIFLTFNIPSNANSGNQKAKLFIKNQNNEVVKDADLSFNVEKNFNFDLLNVAAPDYVKAGNTIETTFALKNIGNTTQTITLLSDNEIDGKLKRTIAPDSTALIVVSQKTDKRLNRLRLFTIDLTATSQNGVKKLRRYKTVRVVPKNIKQEDPYLRFPVAASLLFSTYTRKGDHYSTLSAEFTGDGYLDEAKSHHLNFTFRGPKQLDLRRFGVADQYSVIYKYKDQTTLYLGDHGYQIDRLGFSNRYGMGFRLDQKVNDWTLTAFYSKPRLYAFNSEAVYGAKAVYNVSDSLNVGVSFSRSKKEQGYSNDIDYQNLSDVGQIVTLSGNYRSRGTSIAVESSTSFTGESINTANFLSLNQQYKNFNYNGNITIADKKYYGTLKNSIRFNNVLGYNFNKWNARLGANISRVNQNLDTLYYRNQPYAESYFASLTYNANRVHNFRMRLNQRIREDQLEPKDYHYKEYGVDYYYRYRRNKYSINLNGSFNNTKNLIAFNTDYRNTFSNGIGASVKVLRNFSANGNFSHSLTNRYNASGANTNYYNYRAGLTYTLNPHFNANANYSSGFSPEDTYVVQNNLNFNLNAQLNNRHFLEVRSTYYQRPRSFKSFNNTDKELFAFVKYTYKFGVPLKKIISQGGILGNVNAIDPTINVADIQIVAGGQTVVTDKNGNFELNNLNVGVNYVIVETNTLQNGVMTTSRIPYEVTVQADTMMSLSIGLMKVGGINGELQLQSRKPYSLKAYLKIFNKEYSYYVESRANGKFQLSTMAPGLYTVQVINMKEDAEAFDSNNNFKIEIKSGEVAKKVFDLKLKTQKIKFKSNNFNIGK